MSETLLIVSGVVMVLVLAWLFSGHAEDPLRPLEDAAARDEKEFKDYVKTELHKAQTGAANSEKWASDLVKQFKKQQDKHRGR